MADQCLGLETPGHPQSGDRHLDDEDGWQLDRGAFETLVARYSPRLFGFLLRFTADRDDAEDLVQEVFVRLVRTIGDYQHDGRFEAWLFRIAANLARDRGRKISRSPKILSLNGPELTERHAGGGQAARPDEEVRRGEDGEPR